ncbi:MAG: hypothetical protein ACJ8GW_04910 [Massilia sp.]
MADKKLRSPADMRWPEECAVCGGEAHKRLAVDSSAVRGVINAGLALIVTSKVTRIVHPVCEQHFGKAWLASGLSQRSQFGVFAGVLTIFGVVDLFANLIRVFAGTNTGVSVLEILLMAYPFAYWSIYVWAKNNTPVRICAVQPLALDFEFGNPAYAQRFATLNEQELDASGKRSRVGVQFLCPKKEMNRVAEEGDLAFQAQQPRSANPYLAPADPLLAGYWNRGFAVAEKRAQAQKPRG